MSHRVFIIDTPSHGALTSGELALLDGGVRALPGARIAGAFSFDEWLALPSAEGEGVLIVPIVLPKHAQDGQRLLTRLKKHAPFDRFFAVAAVLFADRAGFSPDDLQSGHWIEALDAFYDLAVPVHFTVCYHDAPAVAQFHVTAAVSSGLRNIDAVRELSAIHAQISELEARVEALGPDASRTPDRER